MNIFNYILYIIITIIIVLLIISLNSKNKILVKKLNLSSFIIYITTILIIFFYSLFSGFSIRYIFGMGLGPVILFFIIVLGIFIVILLTSYNIEEFVSIDKSENKWVLKTSPNYKTISISQFYDNKENDAKLNELANKYSQQKTINIDKTPNSRLYPCFTKDLNGNKVFSTINEQGICTPVYSKYNINDEETNDNQQDNNQQNNNQQDNNQQNNNQQSVLMGYDGVNNDITKNNEIHKSKKDIEKDRAKEKKIEDMYKTGACIYCNKGGIKGNFDGYCSNKYGDFYGMKSKKLCCYSVDSKTPAYEIECAKGYLGGKKNKLFKEINTITPCLPMTSDFNYQCQFYNPPCVRYTNETECNEKNICKWDCPNRSCILKDKNNYKYKNYSSNDFGYKKILQGKNGYCFNKNNKPDNTLGRAICSPNYYFGIQKVPFSTDCLKNNFKKDCKTKYYNDFGYDTPYGLNTDGCSDNLYRKFCKK